MATIKKHISSALLLLALLIASVRFAGAQTITLKRLGTFDEKEIISVGDTLEVGVYIDAKNYSIYGYQLFLTFYDEFFKLIDANSLKDGIQPFAEGGFLSTVTADYNDTEGDQFSGDDNGKSGYQMRYSKILGTSATPIQGTGLAAKFKLLARKNTPGGVYTQITIDNEQYEFRETAVYYQSAGIRLSKTFELKNTLNISVTGSAIGLPTKLEMPSGQSTIVLNLDDYVFSPDLVASELTWLVNSTDLANIIINQSARTATIYRKFGKGGSVDLIFEAKSPDNSITKGYTTLVIYAPPYFSPMLPDVSFKEDSSAILDLETYITDPDGPLAEIVFEVVNSQDLTIAISNNVATFTADSNWAGVNDTIVFKATDNEGLSVYDTIKVIVSAVNDPPELGTFSNIYVPPGGKTTIYLRDKVTDIDDLYTGLIWFAGVSSKYTLLFKNGQDSLEITSNDAAFTGYEKVFISVEDSGTLTDTDSLFIYSQEPVIKLLFPDTLYMTEDIPDTLLLADYLQTFLDYSAFTWTANVPENIAVSIDPAENKAVLEPRQDWYGIDTVFITMEDTDSQLWKDTVYVNVAAVNDAPVISYLPNLFTPPNKKVLLSLKKYASDIDDSSEDLVWQAGAGTNFQLAIVEDTVLTCSLLVEDWKGNESILMKVLDPGGLSDSAFIKIIADSGTAPQHAAITIMPDTLNFGSISTSSYKDSFFAVLNYGILDLEITDISPGTGDFTVDKTTSSLIYGSYDTVKVRFAPSAIGVIDTVISVTCNDPDKPNAAIRVIGTAFEELGPMIQVSTAPMDFGSVEVGKTEMIALPIKNTGDDTLNVTSISINNSVFSLNFSSTVLAPGDINTLQVTFAPPQIKSESATLNIQSNASNYPNLNINVLGNGVYIDYVDTVQVISVYSGSAGDYDSQVLFENNTFSFISLKSPLNYLNGGSILFPTGSLVNNALLIIRPYQYSIHPETNVKELKKKGFLSVTDFELTVEDTIYTPRLPVRINIPFFADQAADYGFNKDNLIIAELLESGYVDTAGISEIEVDKVNNIVSATIKKFSTFAVTSIQVYNGEYHLPPAPESFALYQNYPNPFNAETAIKFDVPYTGTVTMEIFDLLGRKVRTLVSGEYEPGSYTKIWNGKTDSGGRCASGVYFYRLSSPTESFVLKMILLN